VTVGLRPEVEDDEDLSSRVAAAAVAFLDSAAFGGFVAAGSLGATLAAGLRARRPNCLTPAWARLSSRWTVVVRALLPGCLRVILLMRRARATVPDASFPCFVVTTTASPVCRAIPPAQRCVVHSRVLCHGPGNWFESRVDPPYDGAILRLPARAAKARGR